MNCYVKRILLLGVLCLAGCSHQELNELMSLDELTIERIAYTKECAITNTQRHDNTLYYRAVDQGKVISGWICLVEDR